MPRYDPHPILRGPAAECLRLLADPELADSVPLPAIAADQAAALVRAANVHGTISTAYRHLRARRAAGALDAANTLVAAFERDADIILSGIGHAMQLRHFGEKIAEAFDAAGLHFAIVKGPTFASHLYPHVSDRLYTDIDIVIANEDISRAAAILSGLDFVSSDIPDRDAAAHREFKWHLRSSPAVLVELQSDLVHSPQQRRRVSVGIEAILAAGGGDPNDATALLFIAGVHGALGHQFDRLELVVDVVQAVRGRAGYIDAVRLAGAAQSSGTTRAVAAALALAGRLYRQPECTALSRRLMPGAFAAERLLVTPSVVFAALSEHGRRVSWRRKAFRRLVSRRTAGRATDVGSA